MEGCNVYVFVQYDYDTLHNAREKYIGRAREIIANNKESGCGVKIAENEKAGTELYYWYGGSENSIYSAVTVHSNDSNNYRYDRHIADNEYSLSQALALFEAQGAFY